MKHQLRMAVLLATFLVGLSLAFFSPGASSRGVKSYPQPLAKANASRHLLASRGGATVAPEFDYASTMNKPLRWDPKEQPRFSFAHADQQDQQAPVQESKITPDVVQMVGPVSQDEDLRKLPYIAPVIEGSEKLLRRHPFEPGGIDKEKQDPFQAVKEVLIPASMPSTLFTFDGLDSNLSGCGCLPPDSNGDVGPNHYINSVNSSIGVYDKTGGLLVGPVTYNSFFAALGPATPCGNSLNDGDGVVFYDHMADRWVVTDFAFAVNGSGVPLAPFYQCIGVSKTSDPIAGGYSLYAIQVDAANPSFLGDYPKFGLWPDAYYMSVNLFAFPAGSFQGVRMFALDRASMINGGSANAIAFSISPANLGDQYSLLPATFRTGLAPPVGQPEWFMSINSSGTAGTVENQVFVRRFHVDFATPANSTFGVGATHAPDGIIAVNGFVDAFIGAGNTQIVPNGTLTTTQYVDTLGDKLMYPLVYQNLGGVESIYSSHSVNNNQGGTGPVSVRWYQFNMTGNTIPGTPVQQQTFNNGGDGIWRWMPSINVDAQGNVAIGYSASSTTINPGIRYAGRLAGDPLNNLSQGEAVMTAATGHPTIDNTTGNGRWGDYSSTFVDPTDTCTFWHVNEYFSVNGQANWRQRIGTFKFPGCIATPLPTPTPTPIPSPSPSPTPPISAGPVTVTATTGIVGPTDYPTVKGAFDAINAGTHTGTINIFILGNTAEGVAAVLNASGTGSASYTSIRMQPSGVRTVTGNLATPLIDLNGADNLTIDGLNTGGNSLTISNTNTGAVAGTSTIRFINGASNNTVKNCNIQGSSTVTVGANAGGTVLFSTSPAVGTTIVGNNSNTVSTNNIGPAGANLPVKAITGLGTTTTSATINTSDIIDNNNIFDFFIATNNTTGIDIRTGNTNWTIANNRIYQTAPRVFTTTALRYAGITFSGSTGAGATGNYINIIGNTIGFGAANGTGTTTISGSSNEVRGIDLQGANSGTATSVQGNTISGINQTSSRASTTTGLSAFTGIAVSTSAGGSATGVFDIGTITGNTIGSLDGSSTIVINASSVAANTTPIFGILDFSSSSNNVSNNKIGAITIQGTGTVTGFRGIFAGATAASTHTVNNNIIGGAVAGGAVNDTQLGSYALYGIQTSGSAFSINGNTIRNLNGNANGAGIVVGGGIAMTTTSTANVTNVSRNTISNLTNNSGTASNSIYAIDLTFTANAAVTANLVERNFIHSLSITSTDNTCQLWGIVNRGAASATATATIQNNMIRLGINGAGNSITSGFSIIGIRDIQGAGGSVVNYYFNSVYIGGSGVASSSSTFAFNSGVTTTAHNFRDNIFWNARSNASGGGKNYAIAVAGTAPNPAGLTSNFNDLFANGTGGFVGLFNGADQLALSNWQAATGQDANSISSDPLFVNPTGTAATVDLHIQQNSPCINVATSIATVTNDFDNDARGFAPDIGADEIPVCPNNVAAASNGSTATASSQLSAQYPASGVINGEHNGNDWGSGGGWADNTAGAFPDNVEVDFNTSQSINEIDVYTLKDDINSGSTVTDTTTFGVYGATAYDVQYWTGSVWQTVTGGSISGNNLVKRRFAFASVTTDKIRVVVNAAADGAASRIVEVEAFSCTPATPPPTPTPTPTPIPSPTPTPNPCAIPADNVALATNGSTTSASSQYSVAFPASGVNNGEHNGNDWAAGGGWADSSPGSFPDNVNINFNIVQTINEIDVYTLKDDFNSGSTVNDATTFTSYGITSFQVQYWNGAAFVDVPGGNVTGNNLVKRKFIFPNIATDQIRVVVNGSADGFSRVVEIEAFSCTPLVAPTPTPTPTPSPTPTPNPCAIPADNVALGSNGSTASASSQYSASFPASGVNNGEHNGNDWAAGGGWADGTLSVFPDNVEINFNVVQTINEIDVYTLKDDFNSGSSVNDTTTFTNYGITSFQVQYWNGAAFVDVPGGNVTGNNLVKRKFIFPNIATDRIRVVVNGSADGFSRVVEIEAFSCTPIAPPSPAKGSKRGEREIPAPALNTKRSRS